MEDLQGTLIKGYQLEDRIGSGGFGAVYLARQTTLGREVAVKIILPGYANNPEFIRRFETEANLIARLEHPYITPLHDFWRDPDGAYLVMRYLRGGSVRQSLQNGPFELDAASQLLDQIAAALDFAHRHEVIHRDIKPGNILLDEDGNAYLADFGIAKDVAGLGDQKTAADAVVGSLDYISPEQARSEPVTARTDIYSLGVTLYEIITGEHPFKEASTIERLYKHINEPVPPIDTLSNGKQEAVNEVIQKATAKNPEQRYPDALALAIEFREAIGLAAADGNGRIVEQLTMREQEILAMIAQGMSNREIAEELVVTVGTVKWHITQLYKKLGVRSRVQAIVRARELNLIVGDSVEILTGVEGPQTAVSLPEPENPYKGLHAFQVTDARNFFGRDELVKKITQRLSEEDPYFRFLAVIGPSGSGKSSLVRAGLIASLWKGAIPGSEKWFVVDMVPGTHPLDKLETALIRVAANQAGNLREQLQRDERGLLRVADIILPGDDTELVIVVDQFEETFTLVEDEETRQRFLDLLRVAVSDVRSRVRVVVTLRADYYDRPLHYAEFGELLRARMETVLPLSAIGLERAIRGPAEHVGVTFEQGLVEQIVSQMNYQAGALPLLQYALTELFDRREGRLLTQAAYQEIGGAVGALANRAEEIYGGLTVEAQDLAQQMFMRLVTLGEGTEDARRRATVAELLSLTENDDLMEEVIDQFAAYRLLSLDHDPDTRQPTVEVAHEAILREWERLRGWLNESRDDIRQERTVGRAAEEWDASNRDASYLLRGARLEQVEKWAAITELTLTPLEKEYIAESLAQREREEVAESARQEHEAQLEQRSRNRLRGLVIVLAMATLISGALGLFAFQQRQDALGSAAEALTNFNLAATSEAEALASAQQAIANEARAEENAQLAVAAAATADAAAVAEAQSAEEARVAQEEAEEEVQQRATAEAVAVLEREMAEEQAHLATSRELSSAALTNLETDPELSILLSLQALEINHTKEAEEALHRAIQKSRVLATLTGHTAALSNAIYSPDGAQVATISNDGTVRLWDAATGQSLHTMPYDGVENLGITLMFDDSGNRLAFVSVGDNYESVILHIWDVSSGELQSQKELPVRVESFSPTLSPDWTLLAAGYRDGTAELWDVESAEKLLELPGHEDVVRGIAFSGDGSRLATTSFDGQVIIWDLEQTIVAGAGQSIVSFTTETGRPGGIRFSNDGSQVAIQLGPSSPEVWDLADTSQPRFTFSGHKNVINDVVFHPDDSYLATGSADGTAKVWDLTSGAERFTLAGHDGGVGRISFSPDGGQLVTSSPDNTARTWNVETHFSGERHSFAAGPYATDLDLSPDERIVAMGSETDPVTVWDAATGKHLLTLAGQPGTGVYRLAFHPDGSRIATVGEDNMIRVWDAETGEVLLSFSGHGDGLSGRIYKGTIDVAYSPDGARLATAGTDGVAKVWDAESGEELLVLAGHSAGLHSLAYSPNGLLIATSSDSPDTTVKVWDAQSGAELYTLGPNPGRAWGLSFSPDSNRLATSGWGGFIKVWDMDDGTQLTEFPGQVSTVGTVSFTPDGKQLVSGSNDSISIWDSVTGTELVNLAPGRWKVALTRDGKHIYAADFQSEFVQVFMMPLADTIALAKSRVTRSFTEDECRQYLHVDRCPGGNDGA